MPVSVRCAPQRNHVAFGLQMRGSARDVGPKMRAGGTGFRIARQPFGRVHPDALRRHGWISYRRTGDSSAGATALGSR